MKKALPAGPIIQCAANISEGRNQTLLNDLVRAASSVPEAVLADHSSDPDHNRTVFTLLGSPGPLERAIMELASVAIARIDLRQHRGVHPRIGALDVVPFSPIRAVTMDECVELAHRIGSRIAEKLNIPIYFYEEAAAPGRLRHLPDIRRGQFEGLFTEPLDGIRKPDAGPSSPHLTAGATVIGARPPLVAYNVNLDTPDVEMARHVSSSLRRDRQNTDNLTGVRTLGLYLPTKNMAQVSMNITRLDKSSLPVVFDYVRRQALDLGVETASSDVIGLTPLSALDGSTPDEIKWVSYHSRHILEYWLEH